MIKIIKQLSKIFIIDYFQKLNILKENNKINFKSSFVWLLIILVFSLGYASYQIINLLNNVGQQLLFLKLYLPIITIIITFQAILLIINILYFSKDVEYFLPLPIKPEEIIIARIINIISIIYSTGIIFIGLPLLIYGMVTGSSIYYYISSIIVTFIFPILPIGLISILIFIAINLTKFIKNRDFLQILLVAIITFGVTFIEIFAIKTIIVDNFPTINITQEENTQQNIQMIFNVLHERLNVFNKYFFNINLYIRMLSNNSILTITYQTVKILLIDFIIFAIFILISKNTYIKNLLKNTVYLNKRRLIIKNTKNNYTQNKVSIKYIKIELKKIIRNPIFFIQCIFQYLFVIIMFLILFNTFLPTILETFTEETILEIGEDNFKLQLICLILGIIQLISTMNNLSITAISREGKNAYYMKYIPISLYKQFKYKNIPHIILNTIAILGILIIYKLKSNNLEIFYIIITFIIAMLINILNSYLLLITNLRKPNLNWQTETSASKDNGNRMVQYGLTIINILILIYFTKIFKNININISLLIILFIYLIFILIINKYLKLNNKKLFNKIN